MGRCARKADVGVYRVPERILRAVVRKVTAYIESAPGASYQVAGRLDYKVVKVYVRWVTRKCPKPPIGAVDVSGGVGNGEVPVVNDVASDRMCAATAYVEVRPDVVGEVCVERSAGLVKVSVVDDAQGIECTASKVIGAAAPGVGTYGNGCRRIGPAVLIEGAGTAIADILLARGKVAPVQRIGSDSPDVKSDIEIVGDRIGRCARLSERARAGDTYQFIGCLKSATAQCIGTVA